ncbi:hypothetical protein, conserved [Plasmodium gonderi]|uniref:Uncharacterized protein n=1 Tax=Plasmodium gonderi TaxID=77519 RepID=A0A1Y1JEB5_PLAGO|nr:hypothetical protein, conserved [Plasmodium gonderi]GAW79665.1 hypothetical protein, conserved [Plasmodium gonderi]
MEEACCIPGYRNINIQMLYKPQEDYAFVNDIKAKQFFYNPYFKRELEGPYIKEYHEKYEIDKPLKGSVLYPFILTQNKLNRQCNPFVSYPYGVPRDPPYEKCSKCKGKKKSKKEMKEKNDKNNYEKGLFVSKSRLFINNSHPQNDSKNSEANYSDQNRNYHNIDHTQEGNNQVGNSASFEMFLEHNFKNIYPQENYANGKFINPEEIDDENNCIKLKNTISNCVNYVDVPKSEYYYSYNENANRNSQVELLKVNGEKVQGKSNLQLSDYSEDPSEQKSTFDEKEKQQFSTIFADSDEMLSRHNEDVKNEVESILSHYIYDIKNKATKEKKRNESKKSISMEKQYIASEQNNNDTMEDVHDGEMVSKNMNVVKEEKYVKRDKHNKHPIKQVKICENENIWNKYNVMESYKKRNISSENLKDKNSLHKNTRSLHNPHDSEKGKKLDQHSRFCKMINVKQETTKKDFLLSKNKKENDHMYAIQMSTSNEGNKMISNSSQKTEEKYRKIYPNKENVSPKKKNEKKELTYKNSRITIARTKSLKVRRGTVNFAIKNNNFPHRKKSILSKQKSLVETKFKKQNTIMLKRRKTMSRLNSTKQPLYNITLNKKKVNAQKSFQNLHNRKSKNHAFTERQTLARSKTKVLNDNETKIFKKAEVKMISKNPFNPIKSSTETSKISEFEIMMQKVGKYQTQNNRKTSVHLNMNMDSDKLRNSSIRNKLKSKKEKLFENIISLTKNMKEKPLKKKYNDKIDPRDLLSATSNNSSNSHNYTADNDL